MLIDFGSTSTGPRTGKPSFGRLGTMVHHAHAIYPVAWRRWWVDLPSDQPVILDIEHAPARDQYKVAKSLALAKANGLRCVSAWKQPIMADNNTAPVRPGDAYEHDPTLRLADFVTVERYCGHHRQLVDSPVAHSHVRRVMDQQYFAIAQNLGKPVCVVLCPQGVGPARGVTATPQAWGKQLLAAREIAQWVGVWTFPRFKWPDDLLAVTRDIAAGKG